MKNQQSSKSRRFIPIRVCSKDKTSIAEGHLCDIYSSPMLKAFFRAFKEFAVLSRKLGICFSGRTYPNYSDVEEWEGLEGIKGKAARTKALDGRLLALLKEQATGANFAGKDITFVYWNHRPMTHQKWVTMLREAGFDVVEKRRLADIKDYIALHSGAPRLDTFIATKGSRIAGGID